MKRWLILVSLSAVSASAQDHPVFFNTATHTNRLAQMKADYEANPSNPATYGGKFYRYIKNSADNGSDGTGQANAWMYRATGTGSYAVAAYNTPAIQTWLAKTEAEPNLCRNVSSDNWAIRVLIYDSIYGGLSAGQRTTFLDKLNVTANLCASLPAGAQPGMQDVDQTIGDYFGAALLYVATGSYNSTIVTYWETQGAARLIGGFDAESLTASDRRNAVRRIFELFGAGGVTPQSSQYNVYTDSITIMATEALKSAGQDSFPEIQAWYADLPAVYSQMLSPDFKLPYQWGDDEQTNPRGPEAFYRFDTAMCIAGVSQSDAAFQDWLFDWIDSVGGIAVQANASRSAASGANPWFKCAMVWNPYATRGDKANLSTSLYSEGMGIISARENWTTDSDWIGMAFPTRESIANGAGPGGWFHGQWYWGEFQLWKNQKWAITHPIGYDGPTTDARGTGGIQFPAGPYRSYVTAYRGARAHVNDAEYVYGAGTQGGSLTWDNYFAPPAVTIMEDSRSIVWLRNHDLVVVFSRTNVDAPTCSQYPSTLATYCAAQPTRKQLRVHSPVSPTVDSNTISWEYAAGEHVKVTHLLPSDVTYTTLSELTEWATVYQRGYMNDTEKKYHVAIRPTSDRKWDTFLDVYDVHTGTPKTVAVVQDATNFVDAAVIQATGQNYLLAFNAIQGPDLAQAPKVNGRGFPLTDPYRSSVEDILDIVRERDTGYSLTFNVTANGTKALLFDLDTGTSWEYSVNGGGAVAFTPNASGVGEVDLVATGNVTLEVFPAGVIPVVVETATLPDGVVGAACAGSLTASGGDGGPYTWSATVGTVPSGCTLAANGTWSGNYTTAESKTFTLQACDATPTCGTREFSLTVQDTPTITTTTLDDAVVGQAYSDSCAGSGGTEPYVFTVDPDPPCAGLTLNASTCAITGTPTTVGICEMTITLTDDNSLTDDAFLTLNVTPAPSLGTPPTVWVEEQGYRAVVHYRLAGLPYESSCTATLYQDAVVLDTDTVASGPARRYSVFTNLDPNVLYSATVQCSVTDASQPTYFTMLHLPVAGEKEIPIKMVRPAILDTATRVTLDWNYTTDMAGATSVQNTSCGTSCTVSMTFPAQGVYYYRWRWQDASNNVLATSSVQPLVVQ